MSISALQKQVGCQPAQAQPGRTRCESCRLNIVPHNLKQNGPISSSRYRASIARKLQAVQRDGILVLLENVPVIEEKHINYVLGQDVCQDLKQPFFRNSPLFK